MISKQDVLDRAAEWQLRPDVVEKDYVLGWLIVALASVRESSGSWVFKGGTCVKKCYFETYRFSEDLDFSLLPDAAYTAEEIGDTLREACAIAAELSGIEFPPELVEVRARKNLQGEDTFLGLISYRGPLRMPIASLPRVRFDITQHEPVIDVPSPRIPLHAYPDSLPEATSIAAYSMEELLAEKTRALYERTRPRDLYDVVFLLENHSAEFDLGVARIDTRSGNNQLTLLVGGDQRTTAHDRSDS